MQNLDIIGSLIDMTNTTEWNYWYHEEAIHWKWSMLTSTQTNYLPVEAYIFHEMWCICTFLYVWQQNVAEWNIKYNIALYELDNPAFIKVPFGDNRLKFHHVP